ncbi:polycomb protein EED-like [Halichondria panicea]|uniref:polycomb protein EED-like n=1 Tax=Halichondria panicea TaxID=6063 RepID=UPI00312B89AA
MNASSTYKFLSQVKEEHGLPLFGVQFNWSQGNTDFFATVGSNRATVYKCNDDGSIAPTQAYSDTDPEENFYTCAWSYDTETGEGLLAIGGLKGIIRILGTSTASCRASYSGHGNAVNELKVHPSDPRLLLSASKDHALRLWNLKTSVCIAVLGGAEGHRDEVLGADFSFHGDKILSCGMDHALKVWEMNDDKLSKAIKDSFEYQRSLKKSFPTVSIHFPSFSTRDVHRNYVDCVRWFGFLALSKSCEDCVVLWKPPEKEADIQKPTVLHRLEINHCDIWFIRFAVDYRQKLLALGTTNGKIALWDLTVDEPSKMRSHTLSHHRCTSVIRQVCFNKDASVLVAVCDNGTVWRWDKREKK